MEFEKYGKQIGLRLNTGRIWRAFVDVNGKNGAARIAPRANVHYSKTVKTSRQW